MSVSQKQSSIYHTSMEILTTFIFILASLKVCIGTDTIGLSQSITYNQTLVSQDGRFELGFFNPDMSNKTYLGMWFKNIPIRQVVWVANRVNPIMGSDGMLTVNSTGNLVLTQNGTVVWHTNIQKQELNTNNLVAVLLDSGNLVVRNDQEGYLWQSFDHPSDTLLPGMKLGRNFKSGQDWKFTSWKSPQDPSPGDATWSLVLHNYPEYYMMKGTEKFYRLGPWNGHHISGIPEQESNSFMNYELVSNENEMFYSFSLKNKSVISIMLLNQSQTITVSHNVWNDESQSWRTYISMPKDYCDTYGLCGPYGNCMITRGQVCQCFKGFSPKSPQAWTTSDWNNGCVRDTPLSCNNGTEKDGFVKFEGLKVPDTTHTWLNGTMSLEKCREKCLNDCSCMAYANSNISGGGSGCVLWFGDLIDIRQFDDGGQDLYIRMSASMLEGREDRRRKKRRTIVATTIIALICGVLLLCTYFIWRVRRKNAERSQGHVDDLDLPLFDLRTISKATDGFAMNKKIGEGGFGPVYKGKLADGQEIAVKKLSIFSGQGMDEFINEVKLIAQLQHRNLVKLLGCCVQGEQQMLVYEYMTNGSLDSFIFDVTKGKLLQWPRRFDIICGIARGLMYLHQDSRLRIIHRDLKASNVLLDDNLNPKISDFGTARTFGGDQTEGNTKRIIGTYGYMAPEYAVDGVFSVKSDVFSFGILLLEILCGKRNRGYYHIDDTLNLVGEAWRLWKEGRGLELMDSNIDSDTCVVSEVMRCLHVSLLCVQQNPNDRPIMASVILMLGSEMELEEPKEPGFILKNFQTESCSSTNEVTMTLLYAR